MCDAGLLEPQPALFLSIPPTFLPSRISPKPSYHPSRTSPGITHALLSTRQEAKAFNQPVSFDTSGVMDMYGMFFVRSAARALPPQPFCRGSST